MKHAADFNRHRIPKWTLNGKIQVLSSSSEVVVRENGMGPGSREQTDSMGTR